MELFNITYMQDMILSIIAYAVITVFILIALYSTIYYIHRVRKSYKEILNSIEQVSKDLNSIFQKGSDNPKILVQSIDKAFLKYQVLKETWKNYKRQLSSDNKHALVHSKKFFSRDKLISLNTKNLDRIKALPGLLTAWGLLGTFMAILLGLMGINFGETGTIADSGIRDLINGLFAKFLSSIVALFCSIIFVFYEKGLYFQVGKSCANLQQILETIFPTLSENEILSNMEMNMQAQANTMNVLSKSLAQNSLESIEEMVNMFRNTLTEGATEQFKDISSVISDMANMMNDLQDTQETFMARMDAMNGQSEALAEQHKQILKTTTKTLAEIDKKIELFKNTIDKSKDAYDGLSDLTNKVVQAGEQFASLIPSIDNNNKSIEELTNNLNKSVTYFNNVTNEISSSKLDELIHKFSEGIESSLSDIQNSLNEDLSIIKEGYNWHETQLNKLIETATDNIDKIHSSMNDYTEKTSNFLASYDESISKAISYLNTNVHTMDNSLKDNIKTLENNFADLNKTLESINSKVNDEE